MVKIEKKIENNNLMKNGSIRLKRDLFFLNKRAGPAGAVSRDALRGGG